MRGRRLSGGRAPSGALDIPVLLAVGFTIAVGALYGTLVATGVVGERSTAPPTAATRTVAAARTTTTTATTAAATAAPARVPAAATIRGRILQPADGDVVTGTQLRTVVETHGTTPGLHVWVAVQLRRGPTFPQRELRRRGRHTVTVHFDRTSAFAVEVLALDAAQDQAFRAWSSVPGPRPGLSMPGPPAVSVLDTVSLRRSP